jgi:hypothetical protein
MNIHIGADITDITSVGLIPSTIHMNKKPPPSDRYINTNVPMYSALSCTPNPV